MTTQTALEIENMEKMQLHEVREVDCSFFGVSSLFFYIRVPNGWIYVYKNGSCIFVPEQKK